MTSDVREAAQWATRKDAVAAARAIHCSGGDVCSFSIMGFQLWGICTPQMQWMTRAEYGEWLMKMADKAIKASALVLDQKGAGQ